MDRKFADLSNNNPGGVEWGLYHQAGHRLIGLKATEGTGFVDDTHAIRSENAHKNGIWVLHYHFGHANMDADLQARAFWNQVKGHFASKDFAALDIEVNDGLSDVQVATWSNNFIAGFQKLSGHSMIVYSDQSFLSGLLSAGLRWPGGRAWVAAYGPSEPSIRGVTTWAWQYTDGGQGPEPHHYAGVGDCDGSILNLGTYLRLRLGKP
jgi:lysozyme